MRRCGLDYCAALRRRYFPANRNLVPVHIALFHYLPGKELARVELEAREVVGGVRAFELQVTGVRCLGRGVALRVESSKLIDLHLRLSEMWSMWLIPQDRARFSPHITIQNKVTGAEARETADSLGKSFMPFTIQAHGMELWHYRGGPWEPASSVRFAE